MAIKSVPPLLAFPRNAIPKATPCKIPPNTVINKISSVIFVVGMISTNTPVNTIITQEYIVNFFPTVL